MRKLLWGTIAACLLAAGLGALHFTLKMRRQQTASIGPAPAEEEQTAPRAAFVPMAGSMPSMEQLIDEIIEPIVVEGTQAEPPPLPEFGGVTLPGKGVRVMALAAEPTPRPDEEPGQRKEMPYAAEVRSERNMVGGFWDALVRLLGGSQTAAPAQLNETAEPPAAEEQSEPPPMRSTLPPVVDYQYHSQEMQCPYTGRCPAPMYPVPPPAAPERR